MQLWNVAPAGYVIDAITRAEKAGFELDGFLETLGLRRADFLAAGAYVTRHNYYRIIEHIVVDLGVLEVGFIQPENEHLLSIGAAGLAAMTADTLGEALQVTVRFQHLLAVPAKLHSEMRGDHAHLVFDQLEPGETGAGSSAGR